MWYNKTSLIAEGGKSVRAFAFNSVNKSAKASFVGVKTVKGPADASETVDIYGTVGLPLSAYTKASTKIDSALLEVANVAIVGNPITASTTWTIPLSAEISAVVTEETPLNLTPFEVSIKIDIDASDAEDVARVDAYPVVKSVDANLPPTTWLRSILVKTSTGTSSKLPKPLSNRNVEKAALVGAKTVKGPWVWSVVTKFAFWSAATKLVKSSELCAISTILLVTGGITASSSLSHDCKNKVVKNKIGIIFNSFFIIWVLNCLTKLTQR